MVIQINCRQDEFFCLWDVLEEAIDEKLQNRYAAEQIIHAQVVKLVDTPDLGSGAVRCVGSSPILGIFLEHLLEMVGAYFIFNI